MLADLAAERVALDDELVAVVIDGGERADEIVVIARGLPARERALGAPTERVVGEAEGAIVLPLGDDAAERVTLEFGDDLAVVLFECRLLQASDGVALVADPAVRRALFDDVAEQVVGELAP